MNGFLERKIGFKNFGVKNDEIILAFKNGSFTTSFPTAKTKLESMLLEKFGNPSLTLFLFYFDTTNNCNILVIHI